MVSLNVNAEAKAKVQGSEDAGRYPIVAEVKGPGKDGGLIVEVGGKEGAPLKVALGRIPLDLTVSVTSPKDESVLTISIKGSIGD